MDFLPLVLNYLVVILKKILNNNMTAMFSHLYI